MDKMAKIILLTGTIVGYAYLMELFIAYYGANKYEIFTFFQARIGIDNPGWYSWAYYCMMFCNVISPQLFWIKSMRTNYIAVFIVCMFVNVGMWFERFVIIVTSLAQDFLPVLLAPLLAVLGRDLDLHRHLRHLPLALPALHALPADDLHVRGQDSSRPEADPHITTPNRSQGGPRTNYG